VTHPQVRPDPAAGLLKLYDDALPHVYGYLLARCGDTGLAEDLTAESFLAAVYAVRKPGAPDPSIPWLIGVARHKLARAAPAGGRAGPGSGRGPVGRGRRPDPGP
jgi:DNA-directed RNA polymerase specialized sigma24 family protein